MSQISFILEFFVFLAKVKLVIWCWYFTSIIRRDSAAEIFVIVLKCLVCYRLLAELELSLRLKC